jgi:hypothetical protein
MPTPDLPIVRGTLDLLILKTLSWGEMHGLAIVRWLEQVTHEQLHAPLLVNGTFVYRASLFLVCFEVTEARRHFPLGLGPRKPARHEVFDTPFDVKTEFRVDVLADAIGRDEEAEGAFETGPLHAARSPAPAPAVGAHRALPDWAVITSSTALV